MLFASLVVHFIVLTMLFSLPDPDNQDEYIQVKVKLGIKGRQAVGDASGTEAFSSYLPAAGGLEVDLREQSNSDILENNASYNLQEDREKSEYGVSQPNFKQVIEPVSNNVFASLDLSRKQEVSVGNEGGVVIGNIDDPDANKLATYEQMLPLWLDKFRKYPNEAKIANITGVGEVFIKIDRNGKILLSRIIKSTGSQVLDKALANMLFEADPVLPVPGNYHPDKKSFSYKIAFEFKN